MDARERLRAAVLAKFELAARRFCWFATPTPLSLLPAVPSARKNRKAPPAEVDPKAALRAFKRRRDDLAQDLFQQLDRVVFGGRLSGVTVEWSVTLNKTAGQAVCRYASLMPMRMMLPVADHLYRTQNGERSAVVQLATKVVDREDRLRCTLAHELCHAAVHLIDQTKEGPHGRAFWKWAQRVMDAFDDIKISTKHSYDINYKYYFACQTSGCGARYGRHSNSIDVRREIHSEHGLTV